MGNVKRNLAQLFRLFILQSLLCFSLDVAKATDTLEREERQRECRPLSSYTGLSLSGDSTIFIELPDHTLHPISAGISAFMLGQIFITIDQQVKKGDKLYKCGAMKMEWIVHAPFSGKIHSIEFFEVDRGDSYKDIHKAQPSSSSPSFLQERKENEPLAMGESVCKAQPLPGKAILPSHGTRKSPILTLPNGKNSQQDDESSQQPALPPNAYFPPLFWIFKETPAPLPQPALSALEMFSSAFFSPLLETDNSSLTPSNKHPLNLQKGTTRAWPQPSVKHLEAKAIPHFIKEGSPSLKKKYKKGTYQHPQSAPFPPKEAIFQDTLGYSIAVCAKWIGEMLLLGYLLLAMKTVTHGTIRRLSLYAKKLAFILSPLPKTAPIRTVAFTKQALR